MFARSCVGAASSGFYSLVLTCTSKRYHALRYCLLSGCDLIDVMTVDDIEKNVDVSSNPNSAPNLVPKRGGVPDYWRPSPNDDKPSVSVTLPDVNGISPEDYEVMTIKIIAENFDTVTVTVRDTDDNIVFTVSYTHKNSRLIEKMC